MYADIIASPTDKYYNVRYHLNAGPLELYDLLQVYEAHSEYQNIIAQDVMKVRPLNISDISAHYQTRDAFHHLGGFTPEVLIKQSDIHYKKESISCTEEIVRLIGKRCGNGHLKTLAIVFDSREKDANKFRVDLPEALRGIQTLGVAGKKWNKTLNCDEFAEAFRGQRLESITLYNLANPDRLLKFLDTTALRELILENFKCADIEFWNEFFRVGVPTLQTFVWGDENPNQHLCTSPVRGPPIEKIRSVHFVNVIHKSYSDTHE